MPRSVLVWPRVEALLASPVPAAELEELLFGSKAELVERTDRTLSLDVTPDRLDLLSEGGLGLYLQGARGERRGLPEVTSVSAPGRAQIRVEDSVAPLRPVIAGVLVEAPSDQPLDGGLLEEAIRFQELLHATLGRDRRRASLGIYPWDRLETPIRYAIEPIESVEILPLDGTERLSARRFFAEHPLAEKYGVYGRRGPACLTLRDARGRLLSLPPVLNDREWGEARPGDRRLFLESTGTSERRVHDCLALLVLVFVARGWSIAAIPVASSGGTRAGTEPTEPRRFQVPESLPATVSGEAISDEELLSLFGRARFDAARASDGWRVAVPAWRPDVLAPVDIVEDLVLLRGIQPEEARWVPSPTRGRRLPEVDFRRRLGTLLLGLGFSLLHTPVLVAPATEELLGAASALALANPASEQYALVRDRLLLSLTQSLARNVRHGFPQRFAEVGPVVVRDPSADTGARTRYRAGWLIAGEGAGFSEVAGIADYLLRTLDVLGVREPAEIPGTIPGRAARLRLAGESIAEMGELAPRVLASLRVPVPAAWAEIDLTGLWPLVARGTD